MRFDDFITRMIIEDMLSNKIFILSKADMVFKNQSVFYNTLHEVMDKFIATCSMTAAPSNFFVLNTKLRQNSVLIKIIERVLFHEVIITKVA